LAGGEGGAKRDPTPQNCFLSGRFKRGFFGGGGGGGRGDYKGKDSSNEKLAQPEVVSGLSRGKKKNKQRFFPLFNLTPLMGYTNGGLWEGKKLPWADKN